MCSEKSTEERATWLRMVKRRAMREAKDRRAGWLSCSLPGRANALERFGCHDRHTGCERLRRHTRCRRFERWSDWQARRKCSPRLREQLGRGGARVRRGEAPTRAALWHLCASRPSPTEALNRGVPYSADRQRKMRKVRADKQSGNSARRGRTVEGVGGFIMKRHSGRTLNLKGSA